MAKKKKQQKLNLAEFQEQFGGVVVDNSLPEAPSSSYHEEEEAQGDRSWGRDAFGSKQAYGDREERPMREASRAEESSEWRRAGPVSGGAPRRGGFDEPRRGGFDEERPNQSQGSFGAAEADRDWRGGERSAPARPMHPRREFDNDTRDSDSPRREFGGGFGDSGRADGESAWRRNAPLPAREPEAASPGGFRSSSSLPPRREAEESSEWRRNEPLQPARREVQPERPSFRARVDSEDGVSDWRAKKEGGEIRSRSFEPRDTPSPESRFGRGAAIGPSASTSRFNRSADSSPLPNSDDFGGRFGGQSRVARDGSDDRFQSSSSRFESRGGDDRFQSSSSRFESRGGGDRFQSSSSRFESRGGDDRFQSSSSRFESRNDDRFSARSNASPAPVSGSRFSRDAAPSPAVQEPAAASTATAASQESAPVVEKKERVIPEEPKMKKLDANVKLDPFGNVVPKTQPKPRHVSSISARSSAPLSSRNSNVPTSALGRKMAAKKAKEEAQAQAALQQQRELKERLKKAMKYETDVDMDSLVAGLDTLNLKEDQHLDPLAQVLLRSVHNDTMSLSDIHSVFEQHAAPDAATVLAKTLCATRERYGEERVLTMVEHSGLDICQALGCDKPAQLESMNLSFLAPREDVKGSVSDELASGKGPAEVLALINVEQFRANLDVTHPVATHFAKLLMSHAEPASDAALKVVDEWKSLLAVVTPALPTEHQCAVLFACQREWMENKAPKGVLLAVFKKLHSAGVVSVENVMLWRDDVKDKTPGKTKAILQANKWLSDIDPINAYDDEEEEYEDYEDEEDDDYARSFY